MRQPLDLHAHRSVIGVVPRHQRFRGTQHQFARDIFLAICGRAIDSARGDDMDLVETPPITLSPISRAATLLATIQSAPSLALGLGVFDHVLGFGGIADQPQVGRIGSDPPPCWQEYRGSSRGSAPRRQLPRFFILLPATCRLFQSATAATMKAISTGNARRTSSAMSSAVSTSMRSTPTGVSAGSHRPAITQSRGARGIGHGGDGEALLPARPVGDIAHRIDRFARRARGDRTCLP